MSSCYFALVKMVPPSSMDIPSKSSNSKDRGLMKKLKGFDGLAVSIGHVNAEITVGDGSGQSQRFVCLELQLCFFFFTDLVKDLKSKHSSILFRKNILSAAFKI